ncbi:MULTISPECIES: peroxidase-related enzyme [Rhodanobacter]|uniref:Putative peroxidase-related enzyme n=1 Tax=Rhodanobacter denitrificans TaxID=666685 RepID=I4WMZ7_9GAMM|nr:MULTISPECIES: peroxidase-related enzyme [Rhodanobacter]AGG90856.1 putative peroxidase-related enzyme [Rhodanobacter denitrificans]EIM00839.1 peroxidase-related protein [Rhodanobacter denitrificans]UJJ50939.1 peroxidase-related enzyme [Rhodanobacter denitrificans]UJM86228.1 peroxidase-related enzyme [Rhodanobacter denitrificans]UJM90732.1 peroxidase-related enzyme [Rhodanobacter denitrificans]
MGWISEIPDSEAQGPLRQTYDAVKARRGKVARILGVHSLDPGGLQHHLDLYMHLMFSAGPLSRREREAIAVTVSAANGCAYCVAHHLEALRCYEKDEGILATVRDAPDRLAAPRLRAMLLYARRLTVSPSTMDEEQVGALRAEGLTDAEILRINLVTAYFNFVNRIALGLGVEADAQEVAGYAR